MGHSKIHRCYFKCIGYIHHFLGPLLITLKLRFGKYLKDIFPVDGIFFEAETISGALHHALHNLESSFN